MSATYSARVLELVRSDGLTVSDAQDVADTEARRGGLVCDDCERAAAGSGGSGERYGIYEVCGPCLRRRFEA